MIPLSYYLILGAILFGLSFAGIIINRKNLIVLLMCIELMLLAVNTNFVAFAQYLKVGMGDAYMALEGGMVQMISHAFGSGAMFLAFGILYEQMHTRQIKHFGGIAKTMPIFAAFFMLFAMSNVALPGTSGFVGEFMILLSTFKASF